jgi:hypothetical protein
MNAGKKLDALIAEKVMGCKVVRYNDAVTSAGCECADAAHTQDENTDELKDYSTDIAAAWLVVEKLDLLMQYALTRNRDCAPGYAIFEDTQAGDGQTIAEASTVPLVICLAALKLQEEVENPPPVAENVVHLVCGTHPERCRLCMELVCPKCYPYHEQETCRKKAQP